MCTCINYNIYIYLDGLGVLGLRGMKDFAAGLNSLAFGFNVDFLRLVVTLSTDATACSFGPCPVLDGC